MGVCERADVCRWLRVHICNPCRMLFIADDWLIKVTTCKHRQPSVSALRCVGLHLCVVSMCVCVLWVAEGDIPE
jgi:hypothetical protein